MPLENLVIKLAISDGFIHFWYDFRRFHSFLGLFVEKLFTNIFYRADSMRSPYSRCPRGGWTLWDVDDRGTAEGNGALGLDV